jgi:hypothetical protein
VINFLLSIKTLSKQQPIKGKKKMFFTHWFSSFAPNVVLTCLDKDKEALRALNLLRGSQTDFKQEIMTRTLNLNTL